LKRIAALVGLRPQRFRILQDGIIELVTRGQQRAEIAVGFREFRVILNGRAIMFELRRPFRRARANAVAKLF